MDGGCGSYTPPIDGKRGACPQGDAIISLMVQILICGHMSPIMTRDTIFVISIGGCCVEAMAPAWERNHIP